MSYINPVADPRWLPARTDMGVDWMPTVPLPVEAIGAGVVTSSVPSGSGWPSPTSKTDGAAIVYELTDPGPHQGEFVYVAENLTGLVPVGTQVSAGQQIATALPGYPWTEWGEARPPGSSASPITPYAGAPDGTPMPGGQAFARFLTELGAKPLQAPGAGPDRISTAPSGAASGTAGAVSGSSGTAVLASSPLGGVTGTLSRLSVTVVALAAAGVLGLLAAHRSTAPLRKRAADALPA
ncbi:MAG TPA: hypothetical protein VKQ71_17665 [Acidimicrobiales bacterium]|nr:hypothetical protein [Acidimicrobiales bacterium]